MFLIYNYYYFFIEYVNQNDSLTNEISKQVISLNSSLKPDVDSLSRYSNLFPISTEQELYDLEKLINAENKHEIVCLLHYANVIICIPFFVSVVRKLHLKFCKMFI